MKGWPLDLVILGSRQAPPWMKLRGFLLVWYLMGNGVTKVEEQGEVGESSHYPVSVRVGILMVEIKGLEGVGAAVRQLLRGFESCSHCRAGGIAILR